MKTLKPCPFCGTNKWLEVTSDNELYEEALSIDYVSEQCYVKCMISTSNEAKFNQYGCYSQGPSADTEEQAISLWNKRNNFNQPRKGK